MTPSWLKWVGAALGWVGAGLALASPHTIAHQIGLALVGLAAGSGVVSTGSKPQGTP